jgi:hypothetical protein
MYGMHVYLRRRSETTMRQNRISAPRTLALFMTIGTFWCNLFLRMMHSGTQRHVSSVPTPNITDSHNYYKHNARLL